MGEEKKTGTMFISKPLTRRSPAEVKAETSNAPMTNPSQGEYAGASVSQPAAINTLQPDQAATNNEKLRTRSQYYAAAVFERVKAVESATKKGDAFRKKYGGMAHKLPVLIRTAGLAQALAFVCAKSTGKGGMAWKQLLEDLNVVVGKTNSKDLLPASLDEDLFSYMHLTRKTTDALLWFKRFAVSVLDVELDANDTAGDDDSADTGEADATLSSGAQQGAEL